MRGAPMTNKTVLLGQRGWSVAAPTTNTINAKRSPGAMVKSFGIRGT